jgi:hypothetical protein
LIKKKKKRGDQNTFVTAEQCVFFKEKSSVLNIFENDSHLKLEPWTFITEEAIYSYLV